MADKKIIRVTCEGAATVSLDELTRFQGKLKQLSEERYQKLKESILKLGISFTFSVWKNKGKMYIIDAHQRETVLIRMRDQEGYTVPKVPVSWVHARDRSEAALKVLASASQYGEVTSDGLKAFIDEFDIKMVELDNTFEFPEVDMSKFAEVHFPKMEDVSFKAKSGSKELDQSDFEKFNHECPKCGFGFD